MKKPLFWIAVAVLSLGLLAQYAIYHGTAPVAVSHAAWGFMPQTFADVVNRAQTIVEVQVVRIAAGPDEVTTIKADNDVNRLPTTQTTVRVLKALKGTAQVGQDLVVYRTGGQPTTALFAPLANAPDADHMTIQPILVLDDDPPYQLGERHFLLLETRPDQMMQIFSPEGRYLINADNTVTGVSGTAVVQTVSGRSVQDLELASAGKLVIPTKPLPPAAPDTAAPAAPGK